MTDLREWRQGGEHRCRDLLSLRDFYLTQYILCLFPVSLSAIFLCGAYVGESGSRMCKLTYQPLP